MTTIIIIRRRVISGTGTGITGPIDSSTIVDGSIQAVDLAPLSVTNEKIGTVAGNKITGVITNATVSGAQIGDNTIDASLKLQTGTVTLATLSADVLSRLNIVDGSVTASKLASPLGGTINMGGSAIQFALPHGQYLNFPESSIGTQTNTHYCRSSSGFAWYRNGSHSDNQLDPGPGGTLLLRLDADGSMVAKGDILTYSDARLKTNIEPLENALARIQKLHGCTFERDGRRSAGVLAQDVQEVLPEAVTEHEGVLTVAYSQLVGLLIEAIKEVAKQ